MQALDQACPTPDAKISLQAINLLSLLERRFFLPVL